MADVEPDEEEGKDVVREYIERSIANLNEIIGERRNGMTPELLRYCIEQADGLFKLILENPDKVSNLTSQVIEIERHICDIKTRMMSAISDLEKKRDAFRKVIEADYENFKLNLLRFNNLTGDLGRGKPEELRSNFRIPSKYQRMRVAVDGATTELSLKSLSSGYYNKNAGSAPLAQSEIHYRTLLLKDLSQRIFNAEEAINADRATLPGDLGSAIVSAADAQAAKLIANLDSVPDPIGSIVKTVGDKATAIMNGFYGICSIVISGKNLSVVAMSMA